MSLQDTVSAERLHIGFFGMRNAGKSSLVNAVTGQNLSVVSDVKGTTTDPVQKAMELLPLGPVVIIDTPGMDDEGDLGELRVQKAKQILTKTDIAILVADATRGLCEQDRALISLFQERKLPYIIAMNKADLLEAPGQGDETTIFVSAKDNFHIQELKERMGAFAKRESKEKHVVADLLSPGDTVVLVIPIDEAAPKGRLILPQQQTMRDILEAGCTVVACRDDELAQTLQQLVRPPRMVITDSQVFGKVAKILPEEIPLTSFSILFARYKGDLEQLVRGAAQLKHLKNGDKVLISEGCTHHRQCNDIGTVKMPGWIENFAGVQPEYTFTSGGEFPEDLTDYALIVHCGGCMLNEKEMQHRIQRADGQSVPMVNYGVAIAQMHGILRRSLGPFPAILKILEQEENI